MRRIILFAAATWAAAQSPPPEQQIASRLTAAGLKGAVSFLASDALEGRATPSRGLDIAAEYIASQFRRAGLEPAGDDGYFQTALYETVQPDREGLQFTLETGGRTVNANVNQLALPQAGAADLSSVEAWNVPLTDSAALDALTSDRLRGKVLILDLPDGRTGAPGVMRTVNPILARLQPALLILSSAAARPANAAPPLREPPSQSRVPIVEVWDPAIRTALAGSTKATVSAHITAPRVVPVKLHNVIGVLRGSDPALADTYVMLTAHYDHLGVRGSGEGDHIYNGANDDASGTAAVIEIANALASMPARPKRSVVFVALFGEELGLVGSRYYARHPAFPLTRTVADLNLEQLGRIDDVTGPRAGLINVTGFDYTSLTGTLQKAGEAYGIRIVKDDQASDAFYGRSDNQAFADAGVPAHTLSVGYEFSDYHQPGDEWLKLDYDNLAKVSRTIALSVLRIADSPDAPRWNRENPKTERYLKARER
jgi:hypothetical protein